MDAQKSVVESLAELAMIGDQVLENDGTLPPAQLEDYEALCKTAMMGASNGELAAEFQVLRQSISKMVAAHAAEAELRSSLKATLDHTHELLNQKSASEVQNGIAD